MYVHVCLDQSAISSKERSDPAESQANVLDESPKITWITAKRPTLQNFLQGLQRDLSPRRGPLGWHVAGSVKRAGEEATRWTFGAELLQECGRNACYGTWNMLLIVLPNEPKGAWRMYTQHMHPIQRSKRDRNISIFARRPSCFRLISATFLLEISKYIRAL